MSNLNERSTPALMTDLVGHVTELVRKEIQLLRAELSSKSTQVVMALGALVAALAFCLTALNVLAAALVAALTEAGVHGIWAAVIVGGLVAVAAFALAGKGMNSLKAVNLAPERTAQAASRDATMLKEKM
ncbi:MAG: phage holin family protein [Rhodobacteraceae bacterium]|uniref:phage holin family protein n=1 Tax=Amaricoccus sp. B4 TaxID=3368557 RepID=UPI000DAEB46F|nr:phage holin family protein [Paracoccaceae bacterium]